MMSEWGRDNFRCKENGFELLTMTAERSGKIRVVWLDPTGCGITENQIELSGRHFPSIAVLLPEIAWDEREIHDLFGWNPDGHPDPRPLVKNPRWPQNFHPLQGLSGKPVWSDMEPDLPSIQVEGEGVTIMKVGPTHAGIIESGHFIFSLIGENVLHLDAHLFQNHRGVESFLEGKMIDEVPSLITRICAADTVSNQVNWSTAIEQMAGFNAPDQLNHQRILLLEAERVLSHLNDLAQIPAGVGFQVAHQYALAIKENWQRFLSDLYGHRFLFDTVRPGWAHPALGEELVSAVAQMRKEWFSWRQLVTDHNGFNNRMRGVGATPLDKVIRLGAQGVVARAAGKGFDARQSLKWYGGIFEGPVTRSSGDVQARFEIRMDELEASLRMMEKVASELGNCGVGESRFVPPHELSGQIVAFTESPHGLNAHDISVVDGRVSRYHIRSGAFRNWPLLAQSVAGNAVADFPLINKSFELCYSCTDR